MFDVAFATAQALDEHLKQTGSVVGPLHGLPISLKDNFNVIGKDSTDGFVAWVNDPAKYNSALVDLLINAGAIIYVKTNVPTAMMIAETVNNTFGRTVNPRNRKLTSGGSSGGESSLIAFGGSVLGVGTDIGEQCTFLRLSCADTVYRWICSYTCCMHGHLHTSSFLWSISYWSVKVWTCRSGSCEQRQWTAGSYAG